MGCCVMVLTLQEHDLICLKGDASADMPEVWWCNPKIFSWDAFKFSPSNLINQDPYLQESIGGTAPVALPKGWPCVCLFTTHCCVCTWIDEIQSTNSEYGTPYLGTCHVLSFLKEQPLAMPKWATD